ncbi:MAG TPA: YdeI/OmpD-associated family protein [Vicinamibacterales bacterium]|nr:YdeI/OmpD-associated family protein [Vicinamibacterales bacterium]
MSRDPRVDAYIAKVAPFAQPILKHVREAVHAGCPEVEETIKWGVPAFEYKGPFCGMAAFKKHVMFGFWKHQLMLDLIPKGEHRAFGQYGRIQSMDDVPSRTAIVKLVKAARKLNDDDVKVPRTARAKKPPVKTPAFLAAALKKNAKAAANYDTFPPSHKREYVEWLTEAKTAETRDRRLAQAMEWIAVGKHRNWKYM